MPDDEPSFDRPCYCGGENPDWGYHHPDGCAATAQAFRMVVDDPAAEASLVPIVPDDEEDDG